VLHESTVSVVYPNSKLKLDVENLKHTSTERIAIPQEFEDGIIVLDIVEDPAVVITIAFPDQESRTINLFRDEVQLQNTAINTHTSH